jgi:hypothetical protein
MTSKKQRQDEKESAILIALRNGMALMRRDLEIHGMKVDGSTIFLSRSVNYDLLWGDALRTLKDTYGEDA